MQHCLASGETAVLWTNTWFRYAAYGVAWAVGRLRRWLDHSLVQPMIGFLLFAAFCGAAAGSLRQLQMGRFPPTPDRDFWAGSLTGTFVGQIMVGYLLLLLVRGA